MVHSKSGSKEADKGHRVSPTLSSQHSLLLNGIVSSTSAVCFEGSASRYEGIMTGTCEERRAKIGLILKDALDIANDEVVSKPPQRINCQKQ
mmetsp:Transcript_13693/g.20077  ORF Transcript_13693/g.20077 Transcript_13693/m.20077 type:complete len:92 (+) Transcript_13693:133-408(+)